MNHIETLIRRQRREPNGRALLSMIVDIEEPHDLIGWIAAARKRGEAAFYWEKPDDGLTIAAVGRCWQSTASGAGRFHSVIADLAELRDNLSVETSSDWLASPLLTGGFSFGDDDPQGEVWRGFAAARMTLPSTCVVRRGDSVALIRNVEIREDSDIGALARVLADDSLPPERASGAAAVAISGRDATPPAAAWTGDVRSTIDAIRRGEIDKVVLARSCQLDSDDDFELARVLARLRAGQSSCTIFAASGDDGGDFVGATPETLVALQDRSLRTLALAGTVKRGGTERLDSELRRSLEMSDKERREHEIVVRGISDDLRPLCETLEVGDEPEVLGLHDVQHLRTPISGVVRPGCHILDVAAALHPSPAVGGYPKRAARQQIAARERFERGWYAAPVGWVDLDGNGELAVGLRSGVLRGKRAYTFAGAGIVANSDPAAELAETELKLEPMLHALTEES